MRKPRPAIPRWAWYQLDGCYCCKNRNNCSGCKILKGIVAKQKEKYRQKTRNTDYT